MRILKLISETFISIIGNERGNVFVGDGDAGSSGDNAGANGEAGDAVSDGGTAGTGGVNEGEGSTNTSNEQKSTVNYPEGMDPSLIDHPALNAFVADDQINYANVLKSYVHQQKMLGKDKIVVPDKDTSEDQWKETFRKLGVPEKLEDYTIENKIPEGVEISEDMFEGFKKLAHEKGILPKQAQEVADYYNQSIANTVKAQLDASRASMAAESEALKSEWGADYERNLNYADQGLSQFADESMRQYFIDSGLAQNPKVQKLFSDIGKSLAKEDGHFNDTTKNDFGMSLDDINDKISGMYKDITEMSKVNTDRPAKVKAYKDLIDKKMRMEGKDPNQIISAN